MKAVPCGSVGLGELTHEKCLEGVKKKGNFPTVLDSLADAIIKLTQEKLMRKKINSYIQKSQIREFPKLPNKAVIYHF